MSERAEATADSSAETRELPPGVKLIPRPNGNGALLSGGLPGNRGNPNGRPRNSVRSMLRLMLAKRISVIRDIADGKPIHRTRVPIALLLPHLVCANCGEQQIAEHEPGAGSIEVEAMVSASPRDRLAALEIAARYGVGVRKEVSVDNVRGRVQRTLDIIERHLTAEQYAVVVEELQPIWT